MKKVYFIAAAVAISAMVAVSTAPSYAAHAKSHKSAKYKQQCKKDKQGKCMHLFSAMGRGDNSWHGTRKEWQKVRAD